MAEKEAYCQAASTGKYDKPSGLLGKYDNVRRFWEDQITACFLVPAINDLVESRTRTGKRLRILDLGCGAGDGFELLSGVTTKDPHPAQTGCAAVSADALEAYVGVDINDDLIQQAMDCHGAHPATNFTTGDLCGGLPDHIRSEPAFDLYFAGYGTLSHFHDDENAELIAQICRHASDGAVFVGDWLGRYSYEWQDLWPNPADREYFMDYRISYIYAEEERDKVDVSSFALRLMHRSEIEAITAKAAEISGCRMEPLVFFDRSILIGRHMETGDYNKNVPKGIRGTVNSLFEHHRRTDLNELLVDYVPLEGFDEQNRFFELFFGSCNRLVKYTQALLEGYNADTKQFASPDDVPMADDRALKNATETMRRVIESTGCYTWAEARANIVEPMLGYCLRQLEIELQPGTGMGHGLIGGFLIRK